MRSIYFVAFASGITASVALAGGGTVTSTEPGPQTLTTTTMGQLLDQMGVDNATAQSETRAVTYTPPSRNAVVKYSPPPPAPAVEEEKAPKEVAAASGPLDPRETARQCATCHGYDGLARIPTAPNIAGSSRQYLETQLKAFRSGKRENEVMSVIAEDLSNAEIKAVSKWYAGLKVNVEGAE